MLAEKIMEIINTSCEDSYKISQIIEECKKDIFERSRKEHCTPSRLKTVKGIEHAMKSIKKKDWRIFEKAYKLDDGRIAWTNTHVLILADHSYADEISKEYIWQPEEIEQENIGKFPDFTRIENMEYKYEGTIEADKVKAAKAFWKGRKKTPFIPIVISYGNDKKVAWYNVKYIEAICKIYNESEIHFMAVSELAPMVIDKDGVKTIATPMRVNKEEELANKVLAYLNM